MNDSRYIAKEIMSILSNVVRDDDELEGTSKHIKPLNGTITTRLKKNGALMTFGMTSYIHVLND